MVAAVLMALGAAGQMASGIMSAQARRGEFDEQIRQIGLKRDITLGKAFAKVGASNIDMGSASTMNYLRSLTAEFNREIRNLRKTRNATFTADLLGSFSGGSGGAASAVSAYQKTS